MSISSPGTSALPPCIRQFQLGIAIGDVSGKGFPAALLMASLRASLRAQTMRGEPDLAAMMRNINTLAYGGSAVNKYATFFYGEYSPRSRLLSYVNAGHEPSLIFRGDSVIRLHTGGPVVGLLPSVRYEQGSLMLEPGDILVALTDGISEAMNPSDEEWGVENLISCVRNCDRLASGDLIEGVIASADAFAAGANPLFLVSRSAIDGRTTRRAESGQLQQAVGSGEAR